MERRFALLDRDGTVIIDKHYLADPDAVELIDGAARGLRKLADLGLGLIIVTNQSAVGRGLIDVPELDAIHRRMQQALALEGVEIDAIYYCPHLPDAGCGCRKPRTGLVERAAKRWNFDPARSFVIGDMASDIRLGQALRATTLLVRTGRGAELEAGGEVAADHVVDDLEDAARVIAPILQVDA